MAGGTFHHGELSQWFGMRVRSWKDGNYPIMSKIETNRKADTQGFHQPKRAAADRGGCVRRGHLVTDLHRLL